jgi:8-oxo-dGTP pyrophosphatase MutT (NUDIX family)
MKLKNCRKKPTPIDGAADRNMKKTTSAGGVVLNRAGKVLVVNQRGDSWSLPKGHIERGEEPLAAAMREIHEESGIGKLDYIRDLGRYERFKIGLDGNDDTSELKTIIMFLFRTRRIKLSPIDAKNPEARWVDKKDVARLLTHPKDRRFFESVLDLI